MNGWINKQALSWWQQIMDFLTKDVISPEKKKLQTYPSPAAGIHVAAETYSLTPLVWNTCSCFSVLRRMLLRSIISENFKACQKHSPFQVCSSLKEYLYFPNGQEEALTGIEVMLMQCGASFFFFLSFFSISFSRVTHFTAQEHNLC